ncbi:MAG: SpoIID/LytB domain-containing protein [Gemmatimonadales bacterium]
MTKPGAGLYLVLALASLGSCLLNEPEPEPVPQLSVDPEFRIGVRVNASKVTFGAFTGLRIIDADEGVVEEVDPDVSLEASTRGSDVIVRGTTTPVVRRTLVIESRDSNGTVRIDGREYRGRVELRRGESGLTVINRVGLEQYLAGVVGAEMGRRAPGEEEALKAQAVVSRTYALRNKGRWAAQGFDLMADVSAQAYAGLLNENPMASAAVDATRGLILTYNGEPIEAFYSSTCGGRTEDGSAAFGGANEPYLKSFADVDENGTAWCAISPRYQWREQWDGRAFSASLRKTLAAERLSTGRAGDLREMRVLSRTGSGRIATLELSGSGGRTTVSGQAIRRVLSPPAGGWLRSTDFTVRLSRQGSRIESVVIEGRGNGHGVGMCQWGAVGRARAGHHYDAILMSYFPGTELRRNY